MAESNHLIEGPLVITGLVCGLTGCSLGAQLVIAGLVCGLTGCAPGFGSMPSVVIPTLFLGIVGVLFGFIGRRRSLLESTHSPLALPALIVGCVAVGLATIGFVIVTS
jgi:hypothetical protein